MEEMSLNLDPLDFSEVELIIDCISGMAGVCGNCDFGGCGCSVVYNNG